MMNCANSSVQSAGDPAYLVTDDQNNTPISAKMRYIAKRPTRLLKVSTIRI
jgi:hypothetical protein